MTQDLDDFVRRRAKHICEYCLLPENVYRWRFEIDHVIAEQHGGQTVSDNLALSCPKCNRQKGPNVAGVDPLSGTVVPLFNPRLQHWNEHFALNEMRIEGTIPSGRATVVAWRLNDPIRLATRARLIEERVYPPAR